MGIVLGQVVCHTRQTRVHIGPAQFLGAYLFSRSRLHQRWPTQKNGGLAPHHNGFIAHGRHISTTCGATAHYHCNLRNALGAQVCLVVKNTPEVLAVWKHLILAGQIGPPGIHQINTRQVVFCSNFLGTQMLFNRQWKIRAALHRGIVAYHHAIHTAYPPYTRNGTRTRRSIVVKPPGCQRCNFQKRRTHIQKPRHPAAWQQLAPANMPLGRLQPPAQRSLCQALPQLVHQLLHGLEIGVVIRVGKHVA